MTDLEKTKQFLNSFNIPYKQCIMKDSYGKHNGDVIVLQIENNGESDVICGSMEHFVQFMFEQNENFYQLCLDEWE